MPRSAEETLKRHLALYQNNPAGVRLPREAAQALQTEFERIWGLIQCRPESYTPSDLEYAVFNALASAQHRNDAKATRVIGRYWDGRGRGGSANSRERRR